MTYLTNMAAALAIDCSFLERYLPEAALVRAVLRRWTSGNSTRRTALYWSAGRERYTVAYLVRNDSMFDDATLYSLSNTAIIVAPYLNLKLSLELLVCWKSFTFIIQQTCILSQFILENITAMISTLHFCISRLVMLGICRFGLHLD